MAYYKRVVYMDCYRDGEREGNAGFVKLLMLGDRWCLQAHVTNLLHGVDQESEVIFLRGEERIILGRINIKNGRGVFQCLEKEESRFPGWNGRLEILLSRERKISCDLRLPEQEGKLPRDKKESSLKIGDPERCDVETGEERTLPPKRDDVQKHDSKPCNIERQITGEDNRGNPETETENENVILEEIRATNKNCMKKMYGDKWEQIRNTFPQISPFGDERSYVRLGLSDLLILPAKNYRLAENSFLLHGYCNYEHLILTKMYRRGMPRYYLGVPGNYYEKEKQVASWFGFESFEPRLEPAEEGDFGYYMISVEL